MHDDESPNDGLNDSALNALEAKLASLAPRSQIDRDRLMFAAGRQAANRGLRRKNRLLSGASLVFALIATLPMLSGDSSPRAAAPQLTSFETKTPAPDSQSQTPESDQSGQASVALAEGPTLHRLLKQWEEEGQRFETDEPAVAAPDESLPNGAGDSGANTSRELLLRYLDAASDRS